MSKRKLDVMLESDLADGVAVTPEVLRGPNKHSLDSDEEDSGAEDPFDVLHENDIEGEEDGDMYNEGEVLITPFNMKEELQEGHFDKQGHYHWKKETGEVKDWWLDNIDWVKVKAKTGSDPNQGTSKDDTKCGLGEESDSDPEDSSFDLIETYKQILEMMQPNETITKAIQRLGGKSAKISSVERWRRKKAGIEDPNAELVTKITSLANEILTQTGNMDIYEEDYESIKKKIESANKSTSANAVTDDLDMYADDFDSKEKKKMTDGTKDAFVEPKEPVKLELMWEFKWSQDDADKIHGPHTTEQMQAWVGDGYFKTGVWVRKVGQDGPFYTSNRIDFELYL